ncbi:MAG: hypothetical protein QXK93_07775, partial [Candidatus Bathyarchaeia archaeon]
MSKRNILQCHDLQSARMCWISSLIPKHVWKPIVDEGDPTIELADPNATGNRPFKLVKYQRNVMAVLTRNDE